MTSRSVKLTPRVGGAVNCVQAAHSTGCAFNWVLSVKITWVLNSTGFIQLGSLRGGAFNWVLSVKLTPRFGGAFNWVQGLGYRVQGGFDRVQGLGFRVQGSGFRVQGAAHSTAFRV